MNIHTYNGFDSIVAVFEKYKRLKYAPAFICFGDMYYPVQINSTDDYIVIGKEYIFHKNEGFLHAYGAGSDQIPMEYTGGDIDNDNCDIYTSYYAKMLRTVYPKIRVYVKTRREYIELNSENTFYDLLLAALASTFHVEFFNRDNVANMKKYFKKTSCFKESFLKYPMLEAINPGMQILKFNNGSLWSYQTMCHNGSIHIGKIVRTGELSNTSNTSNIIMHLFVDKNKDKGIK